MILLGSTANVIAQPSAIEKCSSAIDNDPQSSGQSNYSTSSNYGHLLWKYESGNSNNWVTLDWFLRPPIAMGADNTVILEVGGSLYAVRNGSLVWQYHVTDEQGPVWRTISPPCVDPNGHIYVGSYDKFLVALDKDGSLLWKYDAGYLIDSTPAVGPDGTVYVGTTVNGWDGNESLHYYLHAVNPNGTLRWKVETGPCSESAVVVSKDGTIYMISGASSSRWDQNARSLYSIDQNGSVNWVLPLGNRSFLPPAVGDDGVIYLNTCDIFDDTADPFLYLEAVLPNGSVSWQLNVNNICHYSSGMYGTPPVIAADGTIYIGICDGIAAINHNGTFRWNYSIDRGHASTPSISKEGTIFFGSIGHDDPDKGNQGYVFALNPDGSLKWKTKVVDYAHSNTIIGEDGTVYVAANGNIFAINGGTSPEAMMLVTIMAIGMVFAVLAAIIVSLRRGRKKPSS
ncbi:MAG: PQQ-binding-like beta-propeller repeat protein [Methanomassiliicoccus sp.]|nr:PQQ-binding-like beta-propeller repeat protein [Methanomassiliicoccus sp.]